MTKFKAAQIIRKLHPRIRSQPEGLKLAKCPPGPWLQWWNPDGFQWTRAELTIDALPRPLQGLRILHLSDLHLRKRWAKAYDELIERTQQDTPDLILITGDFIENRHNNRPALPTAQRLVCGLKARHGIFAILGNHDQRLLRKHLVKWNVQPVDYRHHTFQIGEATVELIGAIRCTRNQLKRELAREVCHPPKENALRIFMAHYPDTLAAAERWRPHIFLAGHTHGGQICTPWGTALLKHSHLPRPLCRGFHRLDRTWMIVSRGLGFSQLPLRLFCPAEVIELTLTAG